LLYKDTATGCVDFLLEFMYRNC